ncbi:MAG: hypothetical protein HZC41_11630 [Chloroflexi bacterium]|nr:hypothetical protein [Chloroflexota bacterium]
MRQQRSLAGLWKFQVDPDGTLDVGSLDPDREIPVPLPWQAAFPELEHYSGYAWYSTDVTLDESWLDGELLLKFGAVDYWCQVFVNGQLAGEHEGGYTPFTLPIRAYARPGANQIAVRVYDAAQTGITVERWPHSVPAASSPFDPTAVPHGKQEWYINVGGLWQEVTLTAVPAAYIENVYITPSIHTGQIQVRAQLAGAVDAAAGGTLTVTVEDASASVPVAAGQTSIELTLTIASPRLWSPEQPHRYQATVQLSASGSRDVVNVHFGFREISTRDGKLLLNGEPIYLLSALDQDFYPETIYTVPSEAYLRDEFEKAKALGFNSLRCHIKPPDPLYLDLADEIGLLIWAEIPSWRTFHIKPSMQPDGERVPLAIRDRARQTLEEMIARDYNHPSLVIWSIVNEDWGTASALNADDRAWMAQMYDRCKQLDPTRLVVDNSPCLNAWGPNLHVRSDLDDFHVYGNIPDHAEYFKEMARNLSLRPVWTYSSQGDAARTGHEPLILSEFGNWGLPTLSAYNGQEPKWFHIGAWWSTFDGLPGWPRGVFDRFQKLGLTAIWPDYQAFATATQWHQFQAVKYEIETMRRYAGLQGYVLTELTDIYWESNGLLDFDRCPKVFHDVFSTINAPDVIVPEPERYAYWDDEEIKVCLYGSHYSANGWDGCRLHWHVNGAQGEIAVPSVARGEVGDFGTHSWKLEPVAQAQTVRLEFALLDGENTLLAQNYLEVLVLPASARNASYTGEIAVQARYEVDDLALPTLGNIVRRLGYRSNRLSAETQLIVSDYPSATSLEWVRSGGTMLFLCAGISPFFWAQSRRGTYGGGWINNYSWIRPGIHRRIPDSSPLTLPYQEVMPVSTITDLPVENPDIQGDFLAGQVSGWVQLPAVHTVQFRYGSGKVVMTTFNLEKALQQKTPDPVAVAMLHDLIDYVTSEQCQPRLSANF